MTELLILQGLPASGKTTFAWEWVKEDRKNRVRVNRDDIRFMLKDKWSYNSVDEAYVTIIEDEMIAHALNTGKSVVLDATNLNQEYLLHKHKLLGARVHPQPTIETKFFNVSVEECIRRDRKRGKRAVGADVIVRMYNKYLNEGEPIEVKPEWRQKVDPRIEELREGYFQHTIRRFRDPAHVVVNALLREHDQQEEAVVICDLDGTLSLINGRSPYEGGRCESDLLNTAVDEVLSGFKDSGDRVFLFSGRNSDKGGREATEKWLEDNQVVYDKLVMRKPGDMRSDVDVKREMFEEHVKGKYVVLLVLDDRDCMVEFWRREIGVPCFQVYYGDF